MATGYDVTVASGLLTARVEGTLPLADLLGVIGARIGADVAVWRELGLVGPIEIRGVPLAEGLRRLAGPHSLVITFRDNEITSLVVIASPREATTPSRPVATPRPPPSVLALPKRTTSPVVLARNRRAVAERDIVKLSYGHDAAAVAKLVAVVRDGDDAAMRRIAVSALGGIGSDAAVAGLEVGFTDPDPQVRLSAARALSQLQGVGAGIRLRAAAVMEPDAVVRAGIERLLRGEHTSPGDAERGPHPPFPER